MTNKPGPQRPTKQLWLLPTETPHAEQRIATVVLRTGSWDLHSFAIPPQLVNAVDVGRRVHVPPRRGDTPVEAVCVAIAQRPWQAAARPILDVASGPTLLDKHVIELALWTARYYHAPPAKALGAAVPWDCPAPQTEVWLSLGVEPGRRLSAGQRAVLDHLRAGPSPRSDVLRATGVSTATLRTLVRRELIVEQQRRPPLAAVSPPAAPEDDYHLTRSQQHAIDRIGAATQFNAFLLYGPPGSGKTEVYVRAMRRVVGDGRQAILVAPEIALATQMVQRIAARFGRVAVLHSQLTARQRADALWRIAAGEVDVIVGTRSAVFAPAPRLGLLIVDEEQEPSLKNLAAPYFHARDVALKRGSLLAVPVVLGSATPAVETWWNSTHLPHATRLELDPWRKTRPIVRFASTQADGGGRLLSETLGGALRSALRDGAQAVLLHNRRGAASALRCPRCGLIPTCDRCDTRLAFHDLGGEPHLRCHRCGRKAPLRRDCPDSVCGGRLERVGWGVQSLEAALRGQFPDARILRLDSDTMRRRGDYERALAAFAAREADILLGTQMIAKGLDFPGVRLVGVIDADAALWLPDFRGVERVFQLLVQVIGRAGRTGDEAEAIIQADHPEEPVLQLALAGDYAAFAQRTLDERERLRQPPFARWARLVVSDVSPGKARSAAEAVATALRPRAAALHPDLTVDDARPCTVAQVRDRWRFEVLLRGPRNGLMQRLLMEARSQHVLRPGGVRVSVDVDPIDLL